MAFVARRRRATRGGGRSWALRVLLATLAFALMPRRATGVWELEQLYEDELRAYVDQFTGNVDPRTGTPVDSKFLRFEQEGWYQILYDQTSAGMDKVRRGAAAAPGRHSSRAVRITPLESPREPEPR
jgi:hypothetical protein